MFIYVIYRDHDTATAAYLRNGIPYTSGPCVGTEPAYKWFRAWVIPTAADAGHDAVYVVYPQDRCDNNTRLYRHVQPYTAGGRPFVMDCSNWFFPIELCTHTRPRPPSQDFVFFSWG